MVKLLGKLFGGGEKEEQQLSSCCGSVNVTAEEETVEAQVEPQAEPTPAPVSQTSR
ncbi:hypothetical protein [Spongiactinospora gelatinilytica]|uniref:hypothetical protein n=1 Tax=Spongiactinospora gelatinilytica TaxID=2666298 RepID=UPI001314AB9E|nr:hypothetical protein [Spongiactinospora gelatinilytica]